MKKISELFSKEELDYLSKYKSDLVPMDVPSRDDLSLLEQPSLDQIIIEFLKQYEVNVEPRNVGAWNGWDTLATLGMLFSREGSTSNIASTIFASNRSNQISGAAQDWGTWKRWALDHKDFDKYKGEVIQAIELHNNQIIDECDKQIKQAELNNKKIFEEFKKPGAKEYIAKAIKINKEIEDKLYTILGCTIIFIPIIIIFFNFIDQLGGGPANRLKQRTQDLISQINRIENVVPKYYEYGPNPLFKDAFSLFGKDLYSDNKILMERLLRAMIRSDFKHNESQKCFKENNPGRTYSRYLRWDVINKNETLRNQLLADKEYWEKVSVRLCNQEYSRNGGW